MLSQFITKFLGENVEVDEVTELPIGNHRQRKWTVHRERPRPQDHGHELLTVSNSASHLLVQPGLKLP